jgi:hypothetical protein
MFGKELAEHIEKQAKPVEKAYGRGCDRAQHVDFKDLDRLGLMPDPKDYAAVLAALRAEINSALKR